jgi:hypothetical protein
MWRRHLLWGVLALGCLARPAQAREPPSRVSVLTMGPGDHPFTRFGHNAILLEWEGGRAAVFNYGTFQFDGWKGVEDFMAGRFRYWLSVSSLSSTLSTYGEARRSLTAQELALTPAERAELFTKLVENARPEHRYYDYDYYLDNCSTRVRDALDGVLHGELSRAVQGSGRLTFREHTLRLVSSEPLLYFGLDSGLGAPTDRSITRWEELFLPQELHDELGRITRDQGGQRVPLVSAERALLSASRPPLPTRPPPRVPLYAGLGIASGAALAGLGRAAQRMRQLRVLFGGLIALLGLGVGLLGAALSVFWASKHWSAHQNRSLLVCPPWALALAALGVLLAVGKPSGARGAAWVAGATAITSAMALLLALVPSCRESLREASLFLPLWAGLYWGVRRS